MTFSLAALSKVFCKSLSLDVNTAGSGFLLTAVSILSSLIISLYFFFQASLCAFLRAEALTFFFEDLVFAIVDRMITYESQKANPALTKANSSMRNFFTKTQDTILSAALLLALSSGINAVLGIVKNRLLASNFGVSADLAIFYTADRIPNLVYSVLVVGALSTIFIPVFTEQLKKDKDKAMEMAGTLISGTFLFFLLLGLLVWIYAPQVFYALSVGKFDELQMIKGTEIMRIMLGAQLLLITGSLISSVLQSYRLFLVPAIAPITYNLGMILGIQLLSENMGILGPALGVLFGAFLHLAIQLPFVKATGFEFKPRLDFGNGAVLKTLSLAPPRILSVLLSNGLATINNSLAILVSASAVIYLKFGMQLQTFPVTLFGASIAAASLPTLSNEADPKDRELFKKTFLTSFLQMVYFVLPASAVLLILRVPMVRLVYGVDNFPWEATLATAQLLGVFTLSIFPQSANYLLSRAFYALKDTVTPVKISLATILLNVLLSVYFIKVLNWGIASVAISYVVTSLLDTGLLLTTLGKKIGSFGYDELIKPLLKITAASALMAITLYVPIKLLDQVIFDTTRTINLIMLTGIASFCGLLTYLLLTTIMKVKEIELFYKLLRKINVLKIKERTPNIDPLQ